MRSHANRGMALEQVVEQANAQYLSLGVATVQKVAVPTKVLPDRRRGAEAGVKVIRQKSTVDFVGVWRGRAVAFDAKENSRATLFPLDNVHEHQVEFLAAWEARGGIGFLLIYHGPDQAVYLVPYREFERYWDSWKFANGRASIPVEELRLQFRVRAGRGCTIDYLAALETYLRPLGVLD